MRKVVCVLAILAAASTAAVAKDLKQEKKATAPGISATQMSDSEMDKVTAGALEGQLSIHGMFISGKDPVDGININAKVNSIATDNGHGLRGAQQGSNERAACISFKTC